MDSNGRRPNRATVSYNRGYSFEEPNGDARRRSHQAEGAPTHRTRASFSAGGTFMTGQTGGRRGSVNYGANGSEKTDSDGTNRRLSRRSSENYGANGSEKTDSDGTNRRLSRRSSESVLREDGSSRSRLASMTGQKDQTSRRSNCDNANGSSSRERHIREYISSMGLPLGLLPTVLDAYKTCESRIWLIENSTLMTVKDSHRAKVGSTLECCIKEDGVQRWEELRECTKIHTRMASRAKSMIPTKFWLVNDPGPKVGPQRFKVGWDPDLLEDEVEQATQIMDAVTLDHTKNPMAKQIRKIERGIEKEASRLEAKGKHITVTIFTEGTPTDEMGKTGAEVRNDFLQSLFHISKLPVNIIVRLCTDNDQITDWFNTLDVGDHLQNFDVLDDFWGEAMEVHMHNPWLTYGIGLHRLREAGLASDLLGELDDTKMSLDHIHLFCNRLLIGKSKTGIPHPRHSWSEFMNGLVQVLRNEKLQWNAVKRKLTPWIDLKMLEAMHGPKTKIPRRPSQDPPAERVRQQQQQQQRSQQEPSAHQHQPQQQPQQQRRTSTVSNGNAPPAATPANSGSLTLEQSIQHWGYTSPDSKNLRPLQDLLVTVPTLFANPKVEPHDYYSKWKEFDKEAFTESGDELKDLLKRAVRKTKFFLHPDKLPKDLTESQALLFRSVWDIIQDSEAKIFG